MTFPEHFPWDLLWFVLFALTWTFQVYFILNFFLRVARFKPSSSNQKEQPVSVIICARNEERNLIDHIPAIVDQDYPNFEVVVVNDSSWDDTESILKAMQVNHTNLRIVHLNEDKQNMSGKKFALTLGIKAAHNETVLLTDADCIPLSRNWIREMTRPLGNQVMLSLGFSPYREYPGWLNLIIRFDAWMVAMQYLGFAAAGKPYMGVGRNLCYTRELFFRSGGFKRHYHIASGDDDLFVNEVATKNNTRIVFNPDSQTVSEPKKTWADWFRQKKRHFTTAPYYRAQHKTLLALWPLSYFVMLSSLIATLILQQPTFNTIGLLVSGALFIRYVLQVAILHRAAKRMGQRSQLAWLAPLAELKLAFLNTGLYITNLVQKPQKWN